MPDELVEMLDLYVISPREMLGHPEYLVHRCKQAILRLFREYLEPIGRNKLRRL